MFMLLGFVGGAVAMAVSARSLETARPSRAADLLGAIALVAAVVLPSAGLILQVYLGR